MAIFKKMRRQRILKRSLIPPPEWQATVAGLPLLAGMDGAELQHLRELATLFLHEKNLEPVRGFTFTREMTLRLAALAVLPIMHLGLDWYAGWNSIVVYPGEFITHHEWMDEDGLMHSRREILSGESWERGPVVLSWADVAISGNCDGYNAVIHEMAHKLDALNGAANGLPPLHREMRVANWAETFSAAYAQFCRRVDGNEKTLIDAYATEAPEEFFAVMSEHFFETPGLLHHEYPEIYALLRSFYRQDPVARLGAGSKGQPPESALLQ